MSPATLDEQGCCSVYSLPLMSRKRYISWTVAMKTMPEEIDLKNTNFVLVDSIGLEKEEGTAKIVISRDRKSEACPQSSRGSL